MRFLFVGIGGSIGSLMRYGVYEITLKLHGGFIPFLGTLLANLFGAFALGWITSRFLLTKKLPDHVAVGIGTGMIGSFTTFSTLSVELTILLKDGHYLAATLYVVVSMVGGILCAFLGFHIGQRKVNA